jgi:hypothetical protein
VEQYSLDAMLDVGKHLEERPDGPDGKTNSARIAERLLKIRDRTGRESPLIANAVQARFDRTRGSRNIIVKARQMGITTWVAGRFFLKTITARGVLTVQVAHTREAAESIFRMVQRFWECLPEEMRKGYLKRSRANIGQMVFPELDSEFRVLTASDENAGRGLTVQNMHCSEVSRWPGDAAATLAGMLAALVPGGELVLESTPNGAYGCFYEQWQQADEKGLVKHFYPWWLEEAYVSAAVTDLRDDELVLIHDHNLTPEQIGFRRGLEASYRGLRTQEFAEDAELCFHTTGDCCFDGDAVERRLRDVTLPAETRHGGALRIWFPPLVGSEYIVAVDPAGGGADGDYAVIQVIDVATGMQCAELQQRLNTLELASAADKLGREYGTLERPALVAVERNNHGSGVLAYLAGVQKYPRIYEQSGLTGWLTTSASKPAMVGHMGALLVESPEMFRSRNLLEECRTFVNRANGSTGAANGAHDDCVMAMAIGQMVRAEKLQNGSRKLRAA